VGAKRVDPEPVIRFSVPGSTNCSGSVGPMATEGVAGENGGLSEFILARSLWEMPADRQRQ